MPNRLAGETSPYLLQHKDNPVDWYPWGEEAFERARAEDKPVLLSVGYSACHWCHVMAHESFEDPRIAALMNREFVNIKVDREERPDVDNIYMQAVQSMTGRGGWPMTVFLTPEGVPFYGGTYYPPEDRHGMPGFPRLLSAVADAYKNKRQQIEIAGHDLLQRIGAPARLQSSDGPLTEKVLDEAAEAILRAHDDEFGGFGRAPKFPQPMTLDFLMRYYHSSKQGKPEVLTALHKALRAMAQGGMYDQVGGGFHRYSTDTVWLVPHFEKMLYDNALLARVYLDAFKLTGESFYRRIGQQTLDYVLREMTDPSGGFYSTQDADSEGEEGKFFLWTPAELEEVLGPDAAALVGAYYGVTDAGNFEGSNILHVTQTPEAFLFAPDSLSLWESVRPRLSNVEGERASNIAGPANTSEVEAFEAFLDDARTRLYAAREQRVHPGRDEKVITAWNGLMLRAFAEAAIAFDSAAYREAAVRNADFLLTSMRRDKRLLRTWKDGDARLNAYLDDYACLADGLMAVHAATLEPRYLASAVEVADEMIALFWDDKVQGFFDTGSDHESLIVRPRDFFDNATPSGASVAIDVLLRLAVIAENSDFEERATVCLRTLAPFVEDAPTAFGRLLAALEFYLARSQELAVIVPAATEAVRGSTGSPRTVVTKDPMSQARALLDPVRTLYAPNLLLVGAPEGEGAGVSPLLRDRTALNGVATAYVCERYVCQAPTSDPDELLRQIESLMP